MARYMIEESPLSHFFLADTRSSWFWLVVRLYLGWEWLVAGWAKVQNPDWTGATAGKALDGFIHGALTKTVGAHPDVQGWYAWFLTHAVSPNTALWSNMVAWGEVLVGIALLVGLFTGIAVFFGMFMNLNYMLAGTVSINPIWFTLGLGLLLAWRVSGYIGLDRYVLPFLHRSIRPRRTT